MNWDAVWAVLSIFGLGYSLGILTCAIVDTLLGVRKPEHSEPEEEEIVE